MHDVRPGGVTLVCVLIVIGAIIELLTAQQGLADYETTLWMQENAKAAQIEEFFRYIHAGVSLLCAYFMLQAKNWARYLYLVWNLLKVIAAAALLTFDKLPVEAHFLRFRVGMVPGIVFFIVALCLLWRADSREYFYLGGRRRHEE